MRAETYTNIYDSNVQEGDLVLMVDSSFSNPRIFEYKRTEEDPELVIGRHGYALSPSLKVGGILLPSAQRLETWNGGESHFPLRADVIYVGLESTLAYLRTHPEYTPWDIILAAQISTGVFAESDSCPAIRKRGLRRFFGILPKPRLPDLLRFRKIS